MAMGLFELMNTLMQHKDKNFVQRILKPADYPKLYDNPGGLLGQPSTHSMAADSDGKGNFYVYPTVVQNEKGELVRLPQQQAFDYALKTGQHIPFGQNKDGAIWFSKNYKNVWSKQ